MGDDSRRFAVLEHSWGGVHWDFLVEDGETLRTWAVDAPIVAGVDLPARALAPASADLPGLRGRGLGRAGDGPGLGPGRLLGRGLG